MSLRFRFVEEDQVDGLCPCSICSSKLLRRCKFHLLETGDLICSALEHVKGAKGDRHSFFFQITEAYTVKGQKKVDSFMWPDRLGGGGVYWSVSSVRL